MFHIVLDNTDIALSIKETYKDKGHPGGKIELFGVLSKNKVILLNKWHESALNNRFACNYKIDIPLPDNHTLLGVFPLCVFSSKYEPIGFNKSKDDYNVELDISYDILRRNLDE